MTSDVSQTEQLAENLTPDDGEATGGNRRASPSKRRSGRRAVPTMLRRGANLQALAALLWLPQAGLIAYAIGCLADTGFDDRIYYAAFGIFVLGCLRSLIDGAGAAKAFDAARAELTALRERAVTALSNRSPLDTARPSSGEVLCRCAFGSCWCHRRSCWPSSGFHGQRHSFCSLPPL